jgi:GH25 family lysozyme M1 (1,4-beta-N-acetylmuramidase)
VNVVGSPKARLGRLALLGAVALISLVVTGASGAASTRAKGIDVSNWNGSINWARVAKAGYKFAFGKATEGTGFVDGTFSTNRNGSENAGLAFGAYHFARPSGANDAAATASAIAQADHFLSVADPQAGELPPVLDLEKTGGLRPKRLVTWTQAWVDEVYARTGVEPFIYSSPAFWQSYLGDSTSIAASGALLWIAHWTNKSSPWVPAENWDGGGWKFWQWTDCLSVPGIAHCTDGDRMNGARPATLEIQPYSTDSPALSSPPSIVGQAEAGKLLAVVPGTWQGGKPVTFAYQWKRCDAAGRNCVPITGATHEKYKPVSGDVGHSLKVLVTAAAASGSVNALAPPTVAVSPAGTPPSARPTNLTLPKIVGKKQDGQILTSSVGTWSGSPTKFAYRWQRCDATGLGCVAIKKATGKNYTLTPDDIGSTLTLVVTATGKGGAGSARTSATRVVYAAPLPPVSIGSQVVQQGVAGNVQTEDGRAVATWQPGAVPVGLTVSLNEFTGALTVAGTEVSLDVPGLPRKGFRWPVDVQYKSLQPAGTVLGYSTDDTVFSSVQALDPPQLIAGESVGSYLDTDGLTHILTRVPLQTALFTAGAWGDPTYTSAAGPQLAEKSPLRVVPHRSDRTLLVLTQLSSPEQTRLTAAIVAPNGKKVGILLKGSRLGARLSPGRAAHTVKAERDRPGSFAVRLRINSRRLAHGKYRLNVIATDPWGRTSMLSLPFVYRG